MGVPWKYRETQPCGTYAGYRRHLYRDEVPCLPCRKASAERARAEYRSKRQPPPRPAPVAGGWRPTYAVDVMALLDICEAVEGPGPEWYRERAEGAP